MSGEAANTDAPAAGVPPGLTEQIRSLREALTSDLVERDVAIRLALLAALAGEHLILVGPPGTAKSLIARRLHLAFADAPYFERLLTRFSVPEELFGPLSIKGLEEDRYERLTTKYLPTAAVAFLDEIFKANSAILNSLLTLLNEREFDNGVHRVKTPLIALVGASNELPQDEELGALFDRFLLRLHIGPVTKSGFPELLNLRGQRSPEIPDALKLTEDTLKSIQTVAESIEVPDDVMALLCKLREWCISEKIPVSDRRWRKVVKLLQVSAATNGRSAVSIWDCWLLQHCLWEKPESREKLFEWYSERVGASAAMDPSRLTTIVVALESRLKSDQESRSQLRDESGNLLYRDTTGQLVTNTKGEGQKRRGKAALFLAPSNARTSYHSSVIQDRSHNGHGFTKEDLDELYVDDPNRGRIQFRDWSSGTAYLTNSNNWLKEEVEFTPEMEPTRFNAYYIDGRLNELLGLHEAVEEYRVLLLKHIETLESEIHAHLWVTPEFAQPAAANLNGTRETVKVLHDRISKLMEGFRVLPSEQQAPLTPIVAQSGTSKKRGR